MKGNSIYDLLDSEFHNNEMRERITSLSCDEISTMFRMYQIPHIGYLEAARVNAHDFLNFSCEEFMEKYDMPYVCALFIQELRYELTGRPENLSRRPEVAEVVKRRVKKRGHNWTRKKKTKYPKSI